MHTAERSRPGRPSVDTAFAVGGLAGNNAFGAGFLQAALDANVRPDLISCTSGQLLWVYRYLVALRGSAPREGVLRDQLQEDIRAHSPTGVEPIDLAWMAMKGKRDEFRPTILETPLAMMSNWAAAMARITTNGLADWHTLFSCYRELATILPAQTLAPQFPESFFRDVSDEFNSSTGVGVAFNSFDVSEGEERVSLNERARTLLNVDYGESNRYRPRSTYDRTTADAVRESLWIFEYGPPAKGGERLDGAYYRQIMLSEMAPARTIYVARPINFRWGQAVPTSWSRLQCLKTAVNFNGSYSAERDKILLVNKLMRMPGVGEALKEEGFHEITLVELEIDRDPDFFDYARESLDVFDDAYEKAVCAFKRRAGPKSRLPRSVQVFV
ncbi:MAG: hypothetical protein U0835_01695 [Isosphaeraceae bacterium]